MSKHIFGKVIDMIRNPQMVYNTVTSILLPRWERRDGYVKFNVDRGAFVGSPSTRPEFSATLYYDIRALREVLNDHEVNADTAIELGCGYGRLTPWIAEYAEWTAGVELNVNALEGAVKHYPDIDFLGGSVTSLPFSANSFDLIVSWTVLGHVPPEVSPEAIKELKRLLTDDGKLILCEETHGESGDIIWSKTSKEYEQSLEPLKLVDRQPRVTEPPSLSPGVEIMVFEPE